MPTNKPRTMITFNDEELREKVDAYRFEHRFKSQNDALMSLINKGIEQFTGETPTEPTHVLSPEEKRLLRAYHAALPVIQSAALQMLESNPAAEKEKYA